MGGYGAIHTGFAYPDTFSKVIALSSANFVDDLHKMADDNPIANRAYYELCFGDLNEAANTLVNPRVQVETLQKEGKSVPSVWMACGTEDFGYDNNVKLHEMLKEHEVDVTYHEGPGEHNWTFWNSCLEPSLKWMLDVEK